MKKINLTKKDIVYLLIIVLLIGAVITVGLVLGLEKKEDPFTEYYNAKCSSYAVQNSNLSKEQIVFLGDSITDLCCLDDYYGDLSLACYNRGIGGDTTDGVLKRLEVSAYDLMPKKVVLMIGTNDVNGGKSEKYIIKNYEKIINGILDNIGGVQLYCISIIPQNKDLEEYADLDTDAQNKKIQSINGKIKALSESRGATYIDLYPLLIGPENNLNKEYSDDGLHLNDKGFIVWSNLLKPYLV